MNDKISVLNWSDRFALIDKYQPTNETICRVFRVNADELAAAQDLRSHGNFKSKPEIQLSDYADLLKESKTAPTKSSTATTHTKPKTPPTSATKVVRVPKKRGRKGSKIANAFLAIPATPVPVEDFIAEHEVSLAVLRQSRRFDKSGMSGDVRVKQSKDTKQLMVWREASES